MNRPPRLAILGRPDSWHVERLANAGRGLGADVVVAPFEKLVGSLSNRLASLQAGGRELLSFDGVMVRGIPPGSLEQVVVRMDALHRLEAAGVRVLNRPSAIEACVDKYLAASRLHAAGLPIPRTICCESLDEGIAAFAELGGRALVKPIFGAEGRGIVEIADEASAYRVLRALAAVKSVCLLQEFIPNDGWDVRAFVIGGRVVAAMKRFAASDFRTNAARGGRCEAWRPTQEVERLARLAADAVGAPLAGVDLIKATTGKWFVIEVNSTPGFQAIEACTAVPVARLMMELLIQGERESNLHRDRGGMPKL